MKRHAELHYDHRTDLLTAENLSSFARFDVLYVFGGASLVRALSEHQLRVEDGIASARRVIEFDPPRRAKRERNVKTLANESDTFAWVS